MRVAIIDADLVSRSKHRFPNLASMKISGYHKSLGDEVTLETEYNPDRFLNHNIVNFKAKYDRIYISKVFVDTNIPYKLLNMDMVMYGGSGFYYSDAEDLPPIIEHFMPDYHLYDDWIIQQKANGSPDREFKYYELYSMGYTTRGCVRQCNFCINKHCTHVEKASPVSEFFDAEKRYLCLLDDNVLAYENWKEVFEELNATGKQFEFKQGLDIRSMTEEKAKVLIESNLYINGIYFAFDNISEKSIIEEKLKLWRKYYRKHTNMYVLCGYDENSIYDNEFWARDIESTLERIKICMKYNIFPYIMRYKNFKSAPSPYYGMYISLASWCNQKGTIVKYSFTDWVSRMQSSDEKVNGKTKLYSVKRYYFEYAGKHPDIAYNYFDLCYDDISEYKYVRDNNSNGIEKPVNKPKTIKIKIKRKVKIANEETKKEVVNVVDVVNLDIPIFKNKDLKSTLIDTDTNLVEFNGVNIKRINENSADILMLNCKESTLGSYEKTILKFSEICLKPNSNIFVSTANLKSFNELKEFVEINTNLNFKEVTTFKMRMSKIGYCSRFSLSNSNEKDVMYFNENIKYTKALILKDVIMKISEQGDNILSFFERITNLKNIGKEYNNRKWLCFYKKKYIISNQAEKAMNDIIKIKTKNTDRNIKSDNILSVENEQTFLEYYAKEGKKGLL